MRGGWGCAQGNYQNGGAYTFILFITFWILYSYLVPISLFVTLEIVKFWQAGHPALCCLLLCLQLACLPAPHRCTAIKLCTTICTPFPLSRRESSRRRMHC